MVRQCSCYALATSYVGHELSVSFLIGCQCKGNVEDLTEDLEKLWSLELNCDVDTLLVQEREVQTVHHKY